MTTSEFVSEAIRRVLELYRPQKYWWDIPQNIEKILSELLDTINLDEIAEHDQQYRGWSLAAITDHLRQTTRSLMQSALKQELQTRLYGSQLEETFMRQDVAVQVKAGAPTSPQPPDTDKTTHIWDPNNNKWVPVLKDPGYVAKTGSSLEEQSQVDIQIGSSVYIRPLRQMGTVIRQKGDSFRIQIHNAVVTCWEQELEAHQA